MQAKGLLLIIQIKTQTASIMKSHLSLALSLVLVIASVPAHSETLIDISAGENHTCVLDSNGKAYCWGNNSVGQLGNGSTESSMSPVAVSEDLRFESISVGSDHACGITVDNDAYCWGRGRYGRLGNGSSENSLVPTAVSGSLSFESVNAGLAHTCGITTDGDAFCWGRGEDGILGNNSIESSLVPVPVSGGLTFSSIDPGSATTCGVTTKGDAYCWGAGDFGSLLAQADGDGEGKIAPGLVAGEFKFQPTSISVGLDHACAITTSDKAVCWGRGRYGKLGIGSGDGLGVLENLTTPREVNGDTSFVLIATGVFQTCGIATDGKAYCWGRNGSGQLGDGTTTMRVEPVAVSANLKFKDIAVGSDHACGISSTDEVYCWGNGTAGKLGTRSTDNRLTPTKVALN
jgi:alpha-tubulin suppressor-like RCC1 family protein